MSPQRRGALAALVAFVVLAVLIVVVGTHRLAGRSTTSFVDQATPGPVLLVPGYGGSTASLQVLAAALRAGGRAAQVLTFDADGTGEP
ncbi:MAG: lipase, partial [Rhodoferax sp.]|nr:lipase [Actinomycetota bacterium]